MKPFAGTSRVPVLMYHEIRAGQNPWERRYFVSPDRFRDHIRALHQAGYRACSLTSFRDWLTKRTELPVNAFLLTFDDGYTGVYEHAFPFLLEKAVPFAVFVVSSAIGASDTWRREASPLSSAYSIMPGNQLVELARAGVGIGSHSRHHPDLTSLDADALRNEVRGSRVELEDVLGQEVDCFAYPYGKMNETVRASVAESGYTCAFSTRSGFNHPDQDPLAVRRIDVYGTDTAGALLRKMRFGSNDGSLTSAWGYYAKRAIARRARPTG